MKILKVSTNPKPSLCRTLPICSQLEQATANASLAYAHLQSLITAITFIPTKRSIRYNTSYIANLTTSSINAVPVEVHRSGGPELRPMWRLRRVTAKSRPLARARHVRHQYTTTILCISGGDGLDRRIYACHMHDVQERIPFPISTMRAEFLTENTHR